METVPDTTDTPECICYDSNLPAHADCPACRPELVEPALDRVGAESSDADR